MKSNPNFTKKEKQFRSQYNSHQRSISTIERPAMMATSPGTLFSKKRESEIGQKNLQLINDAPSMANLTKIQQINDRPSVVRFSPVESRGLTPQKTAPKKEFASPLNSRLEEMKNNLHHLMFNTGLDRTLVEQVDQPIVEEVNPYRQDPAM